MGSRLGRRVIHFANLPIKLLMPKTYENINEIALKTVPSASKIEIKRVLESLYGFDVDKVRTLNMEGKKKKRGGILFAKPDYKKAYVTLKTPLSISPDLFPLKVVEQEKERMNKQQRSGEVVEDGGGKKHWLDGRREEKDRDVSGRGGGGGYKGRRGDATAEKLKFPWSSMRTSLQLAQQRCHWTEPLCSAVAAAAAAAEDHHPRNCCLRPRRKRSFGFERVAGR
ncbi:unnamed protein product [Linum tenue]|uniref:Large ribosomal subunit protein uL23m n=1 Tax=Linum tenue TaxID=586396 RepID=A0AAV0PTJ9_9ROSI|nr:unnamed protein product [Linum tenue]